MKDRVQTTPSFIGLIRAVPDAQSHVNRVVEAIYERKPLVEVVEQRTGEPPDDQRDGSPGERPSETLHQDSRQCVLTLTALLTMAFSMSVYLPHTCPIQVASPAPSSHVSHQQTKHNNDPSTLNMQLT